MIQKRFDKRLFIGVIIVLVGAALLASNFGFFSYEIKRYFFRWEMILIGIGAITVLTGENKGFGLVLIVVGGLFYFKDFINPNIDFWKLLWSSALIIIGLVILFQHKSHKKIHSFAKSSADVLDEVTVFGGSEKMVLSQNFQGGKLTSIFGGQKLIFTKAQLASGQNILELFAIFGGFELIIPDEWDIKVKITPIFGGFVDKRVSHSTNEQNRGELLIYGTVIFGGGEIKSY